MSRDRMDRVPSGPVLQHLEALRQAGHAPVDIERATGLDRKYIYHLANMGQKGKPFVDRERAEQLLAMRLDYEAPEPATAAGSAGRFAMTFPYYGGAGWSRERAQRAGLQYVLEEALAQGVEVNAEAVSFDWWQASRGHWFLAVSLPGASSRPAAEVQRRAEHMAYEHRAVLPQLALWIDGHLAQGVAA